MGQIDLFVGLVSHPKTRFPESWRREGLAHSLSALLRLRGLSVSVKANVVNLLDLETTQIDEPRMRGSLASQESLTEAWRDYLGEKQSRQKRKFLEKCRHLSWVFRLRLGLVKSQQFVRLLNIELSHIDLLESGLAAGARWILILEDDAEAEDIHDCSEGIHALVHDADDEGFINLSDSFSLDELGGSELMRESDLQWQGSLERNVFKARRPITNTVCANLYHREFAEEFLWFLKSESGEAIVPIDWKLNAFLLSQSTANPDEHPVKCLFVMPGPIAQRSMRRRSHS